VAAALEEKLTRPEELIDCQMGAIVIAGTRIRDHEKFGVIPVTDIIAKSSDVGAIKLGLRLGEERFDHYIRAFGFGAQTGIELPGETRGMAKPIGRWSKVSIGAISMGQEIGISAIQLAGLVSTIANDGVWQAPHIVAAPQGLLREAADHPDSAPAAEQRRVISNLTAAQMKMMLQQVVLRGTGRKAQLDGFSAAGKTGTAQKVDPSTGAYSRTKYIGSFAGFAPINNPALTVVVILDSAVGLHQGGQICAPVFQRVMQQALEYLNMPHDMDVKVPTRVAKLKDADLDEVSPDRLAGAPEMAVANISAVKSTAPDAPVMQTAPALANQPQASLVPAAGTVVLDAESGGLLVPSLIGKPVRAAVEIAQEAGFEIDVIGEGVAREQAPPPGSRIAAGGRVAVRFAP